MSDLLRCRHCGTKLKRRRLARHLTLFHRDEKEYRGLTRTEIVAVVEGGRSGRPAARSGPRLPRRMLRTMLLLLAALALGVGVHHALAGGI